MPDGLLRLLALMYGLGLLAAAPIGPVNLVAIRRGILGRWTHTLSCGAGSAMVDLAYFALALWGGQKVLVQLSNPTVYMASAGLCSTVLVGLGSLFVVRAIRAKGREVLRHRRELRTALPKHLWTDVGTGIALTVINPAAPTYWIAATASCVGQAMAIAGPWAIWWALPAAAAGLLSWFAFLSLLIRFAPERIGPTFFRIVSAACGVMLLASGAACIIMAIWFAPHVGVKLP